MSGSSERCSRSRSPVLAALALLRSATPRARARVGRVCARVGIAVTPALSGHARVAGPLAVVSDWVHVLAASAWIGGLVFVLRRAVASGGERWSLAARAVPRFSALAVVSVTALLVAGVVSGFLEVRSWSALWETTYGRLLLVKVALVLPVLALGCVQQPRLGAAAPGRDRLGGRAAAVSSVDGGRARARGRDRRGDGGAGCRAACEGSAGGADRARVTRGDPRSVPPGARRRPGQDRDERGSSVSARPLDRSTRKGGRGPRRCLAAGRGGWPDPPSGGAGRPGPRRRSGGDLPARRRLAAARRRAQGRLRPVEHHGDHSNPKGHART